MPDPLDELDELPAPDSDVASVVGATGATGPDPIEDVADGMGGVGIENPEVVVDDVVGTTTVGSVTVPTPPELSIVTLAVPVMLAASAVTAPQMSAIPLTELAATRLIICRRDKTT